VVSVWSKGLREDLWARRKGTQSAHCVSSCAERSNEGDSYSDALSV
jgi:hypothetical protein